MVDVPLAAGGGGCGDALALPEEQGGTERQVAIAGGGGEERSVSEQIQKLAPIHLGLPQHTREGADLDRFVERNDATPATASHHHMAAVLAYGVETQAFQRTGDLPTGKVRELRETLENPVTLRENGPVIAGVDWLHGR